MSGCDIRSTLPCSNRRFARTKKHNQAIFRSTSLMPGPYILHSSIIEPVIHELGRNFIPDTAAVQVPRQLQHVAQETRPIRQLVHILRRVYTPVNLHLILELQGERSVVTLVLSKLLLALSVLGLAVFQPCPQTFGRCQFRSSEREPDLELQLAIWWLGESGEVGCQGSEIVVGDFCLD